MKTVYCKVFIALNFVLYGCRVEILFPPNLFVVLTLLFSYTQKTEKELKAAAGKPKDTDSRTTCATCKTTGNNMTLVRYVRIRKADYNVQTF